MQHFDRCLLILGSLDLPMAELPDSILIPPESSYEIQYDSGIAIMESIRHFVEEILPDITAKFNATEDPWIAERAIIMVIFKCYFSGELIALT